VRRPGWLRRIDGLGRLARSGRMSRDDWPTLAALLVMAGLLSGSSWLWRLGLALGLVGALAWLWARLALRSVRYERTLSAPSAVVGDRLTLTVRLVNDKLLPLTWLQVEDSVPDAVPLDGANLGAATRPRHRSLRHAATLMPYERLTWTYGLSCPTRGIYRFGPATLASGDPFGLQRVERREADEPRLVVYPAVPALSSLGLPPGAPLGERPDRRSLERDPLRPLGVRPYQPGDSRRMVDWRATARLGALQVRQAEPVSRLTTIVVLNVATFDTAWIGVDPEVQERLIEVAGAICLAALDAGRTVGLVTNGCAPGSGRVARVPPGDHPGARGQLLEVLAGVSAFVSVPVERLLLRESQASPWGATLVVVTSLEPEPLGVALVRVRRAGRQAVLVSLDPAGTLAVPGIAIHRLAPPGSRRPPSRDWQHGWMREASAAAGRGS
jgi:uncharacterized protein (DUF58 family)